MNNQKKSSTMTYLIIVLVIGIALLAYFYMSGNQSQGNLTLDTIDSGDQVVGARVLKLLNEISSLNIDKNFFSSPAYSTLRDYTVEIPALPIGRSNPFSSVSGLDNSSTN